MFFMRRASKHGTDQGYRQRLYPLPSGRMIHVIPECGERPRITRLSGIFVDRIFRRTQLAASSFLVIAQ